MTCHDCPNQTDGKCCHQSIRTQGSKTMNTQDEAAWEREFEHVESKQKQREEIKSNHALELGKAISFLADLATER